eukprot:362682-Chlamydomonas_euryale.AAC.7
MLPSKCAGLGICLHAPRPAHLHTSTPVLQHKTQRTLPGKRAGLWAEAPPVVAWIAKLLWYHDAADAAGLQRSSGWRWGVRLNNTCVESGLGVARRQLGSRAPPACNKNALCTYLRTAHLLALISIY